MAISTIDKKWQIQSGTIRDNVVEAGSYVDQLVTFETPFQRVPTVVGTLQVATTAGDIGGLSIVAINVTTTGANLRVYNNGNTRRSANACWIAIA